MAAPIRIAREREPKMRRARGLSAESTKRPLKNTYHVSNDIQMIEDKTTGSSLRSAPKRSQAQCTGKNRIQTPTTMTGRARNVRRILKGFIVISCVRRGKHRALPHI